MGDKGHALEEEEGPIGHLRFGEMNPYEKYKSEKALDDPWEPFEQDMSYYPECNTILNKPSIYIRRITRCMNKLRNTSTATLMFILQSNRQSLFIQILKS